jgi:hypothetical protein
MLRHPIEAMRVLRADWQAHQRGQKRLVPRVGPRGGWTRGRVYGPVPPAPPPIETKPEALLECEVTRADGRKEHYSYPARRG